MAAPRIGVGWIVLALFIALLAMFVSVPVALLALAFVSGTPLFAIMICATLLGALSGVVAGRSFDALFSNAVLMIQHVGLGDEVETMSTIPLFILAGYVLAESGTADRLVRFANALLGWAPGGLAIVTIGTCALFTVFTGASGVTIIALGGVLMPALVRQGYPDRFSMGLIAGTGSVGLLFPPALPLFIFGTVYGLSASPAMQKIFETKRFIFSGIVPGMVLVGMLSAVAVFVAVRKKLPRQKFDPRELATSFLLALPELFIPFGVIAGLAVVGFGLPEIAALTVTYTFFVELVLSRVIPGWGKPLDPRVLWATSREAMTMVGAIFIIIFSSTMLTQFMVDAEVPTKMVHWTARNITWLSDKTSIREDILFLLAINIILLIVGTVMDIFSAIVVVVPLISPIAEKYGVDPYHLGVIFLLNLEVGYLHPPVGLNLFITSVKFQRPITEVMWATIPFLVTMLVALFTITYVPELTAWSTPEAERTGRVQDLESDIATAVENLSAVKEVTIVDAAGTPLKDVKGRAIVKRFDDCAKKSGENERNKCEDLFRYKHDCHGDAACTNQKIAAWAASEINGADDTDAQIILVDPIALVKADGTPVKDKKGQPIVKKRSACEDGSVGDACRELFVNVSNCKITQPASPDDCIKGAIADWVSSNASDDAP